MCRWTSPSSTASASMPARHHDPGDPQLGVGRDLDMTDPLEEPRPAISSQRAGELLAEHYGHEGELVELHGERDLNFRVDAGTDRYLLKVHNPADAREVVEMRTGALAHIRRVDPGIPVPEVLPTLGGEPTVAVAGQDGRSSLVQLFTFLDGHHAGREELGASQLRGWGRGAARLGRALRGYFHPAAGYPIQWDLRHAALLRDRLELLKGEPAQLVAQVLARFEKRVEPVLPSLRAQLVHNDLSRENVLVDERGQIAGITDFGDMTHTSLVCDLAVALADVLDGRPDALEMAESMIAGYCEVNPLEEQEGALLGDLVATRCATAAVVSTWRRSRHPDAPRFPEGAVEFLRLLAAEGFDQVGERLSEAARRPPGRRRRRGDRARSTEELVQARRRVLGPLSLTYDEPLHLVRGEGVHLFDAAGSSYIDAYNNVPVLGHCHPAVVAVVADQAGRLVTNTRYLHEASVELAERLIELAPAGLDRVLFLNSGSEANDIVWRIACHATGRTGALVTSHAYHGVTEATTALSPEEWPADFRPPHVGLLDPPGSGAAETELQLTLSELEEAGHPPAALFADPAFTSDGILGPAHHWLQAAAAAARAAGALFVADEVQAGYGRTGESLWSVMPSRVEPDFMTLGKPMGNGFPVAALLGRAELVDPFVRQTGYFSTFGGNSLACAAALAVLRVVEEERLVERAAASAAHLRALLEDVVAGRERVGALRNWGMLFGLELLGSDNRPDAATASAVANSLRRLGVLVGTTGPAENVLKIRPPLVFSEHDGDEVAERLDRVLAKLPG